MNGEAARNEPVLDGCVWCKKTREEAADGVQFRPIESTHAAEHGTGPHELICDVCLRDCRWFKRARSWQFAISDEFSEDIAQEISDAVNEAVAEVYERHGQEYPGAVAGVTNATEETWHEGD